MAIAFGTDGWRAVMADEFTFANIKKVCQAVADYIVDIGQSEKGIVIGYDNRFLSPEFARTAAGVMAANGISVLFTEDACPTPVTAFAVKWRQTAGALMITASHNPPEYNGIKFIPDYAGPALPAITKKIEVNLACQSEGEKQVRFMTAEQAAGLGRLSMLDPFTAYKKHLISLLDADLISQAGLNILVDPLYGAGIGYLDKILTDLGCRVDVIHGYRDTLFGGSLPEPSELVLQELKDKVVSGEYDLGLALDGDADRFGIIDSNGQYITPNQVLFILYQHLLTKRSIKGQVARTVATTHMLDRIAEKYGFSIDELPVGFKYIGQSLLEKGSILGGEESGGLSISGHIPEKDGILADCLMVEIMAACKKPLHQIIEEIEQEFGCLVSKRLDIRCTPDKKQQVLDKLADFQPAAIAGIKVLRCSRLEGVKLYLEDNSWVLIRPSGTEPLFRIYAEAQSADAVVLMQQDVRKMLDF